MNRSKKYMMVAALATLSCGAMAQGLNTVGCSKIESKSV